MTNHLQLYFDMDDGGLVNLSKKICKHYNKDFDDNMEWQDNKSYWWVDFKKAPKSYFEELLLQRGIFLGAEPTEGAIETLNKLHEEGYDIHILTMPQTNSLYCAYEKYLWVKKYLPWLNLNTNMHLTGNKGLLAKENRILIDDNINHLMNWELQGGISVAWNMGWNRKYKGFRARDMDDLLGLIHNMEIYTNFMENKLK